MKIKRIGAGKNLEETAKTLYLDSVEGKIAIVNFVENECSSATKSKHESYLNNWSLFSFIDHRYVRTIFNKLGIRLINKKGMALGLNLMCCEAHNDISKEVIKKY